MAAEQCAGRRSPLVGKRSSTSVGAREKDAKESGAFLSILRLCFPSLPRGALVSFTQPQALPLPAYR